MARRPATLWHEVYVHHCANVERLEMRIHYGHAISRTENYNLNGRRPFSRVRLSSRFHLNISFLCAIEIPRPFFRRRAPRPSVTRYSVVTPRNFFAPTSVRYTIGGYSVRPRANSNTQAAVSRPARARISTPRDEPFKTPCV